MSPLRRMWRYFTPVRFALYGSVLLSALTFISSIGLLATSGWLISNAALRPPVLTLEVAIVAVRTFALSRGVARYSERLLSHNATFASLTQIRASLYDKLESLAPAGLSVFRRGDMLARLISDVDDVQNLPLRVFIPITSSALSSVVATALAIHILPIAGYTLGLSLLAAGVLSAWSAHLSAAHSEAIMSRLQGELTDGMVEFFAGATDVAMLGHTHMSLQEISTADDELTSASVARAFALGLGTAVVTLFQGIALVIAAYCGVIAVNNHSLVGVNLAVIVFIPLAAFESITAIPNAMLALARVRGSSQRLCDIFDSPVPVAGDDSDGDELTSGVPAIELRDVSARWPGTSEFAVEDISIRFASGSSTALVGRSGSGKSSIAAILAKFLSPAEGIYAVNGKDATTISGEELRTRVVLSAQDAHIFATSIAENLKIALPSGRTQASDEELMELLDSVELGDVVRALPDGINSVLGDRGQTLSGGQRQRLILARMLLAEPQVWVLDEPTEHLDAQQAERMITLIRAAKQDKTLILLTHKMLDTTDLDSVTVISGGYVIESGTPSELEVQNGQYAKLLYRERTAHP